MLTNQSDYSDILREAKSQRFNWPPLKSGLFGGSYERFEEVSTKYGEVMAQLNRY